MYLPFHCNLFFFFFKRKGKDQPLINKFLERSYGLHLHLDVAHVIHVNFREETTKDRICVEGVILSKYKDLFLIAVYANWECMTAYYDLRVYVYI